MNLIRFSLLSEGPSDAALLPIIKWVLTKHADKESIVAGSRVDEGRLPKSMSRTPAERLKSAVDVYPCDFLVLHRDSDGPNWEARLEEIMTWCNDAALTGVKTIPIIPIQETEAWLLVDEQAIRHAAANPNGKMNLNLPPLKKLEQVARPKEILLDALRTASGLSGRRLKRFNERSARVAIGEKIANYVLLRELNAFARFEQSIKECFGDSVEKMA